MSDWVLKGTDVSRWYGDGEVRKIFPAAKAGKDRKSVELDFEKDE